MAQEQNELPSLPVSFEEWEYRARQLLPDGPFGYIAGGAGREETMWSNREAFLAWQILPRVLGDVSKRDLSINFLGRTYPLPYFFAPISIQGIAYSEGELASARAAASLGVPFILSTVSSYSMETVASVMGDAPRWFQLFWPNDEGVTASLLHRAEASGYSAVVVTLDLPVYGWRERDVRHRYVPFASGHGTANFFTDPAFRKKLKMPPEKDFETAIALFGSMFFHPGLTWQDLTRLRKYTKLPILLKGILHTSDAEMALDSGVDGIIVSNHGGRQVDGAIAALDALLKIKDVIHGRIPILMDSGIRSGADILKAIGLGASAVLIGRPYIYGLAVAGEKGVLKVMENLRSDLELNMASSGKSSIRDIDRSLLHRYRET